MFDSFKERDARTRAVKNPTWLAPEVTAGGEYGEKSDVYSYGIILSGAHSNMLYGSSFFFFCKFCRCSIRSPVRSASSPMLCTLTVR